ncbi:MAG: XRE family transcriptional regulator [Pseudobdellovibrio sp.]
MTNNYELSLIAQNFVSQRLTLAREMRGLTRAELAGRIEKTPSSVSQYEDGAIKPDARTLAQLSLAIGIKPTFFSKPFLIKTLSFEGCHFRSLRSTSQRDRKKIIALGTLECELVAHLETEFELPVERVSELSKAVRTDDDIENLATEVRQKWQMGLGPILNMAKLLEAHGIIVSFIPNDCSAVDAFSVWNNSRPMVFLTKNKKSGSRLKFDSAHELGHLIMHHDVSAGDFELERQANRFASAFLLPKDAFLSECPTRFKLDSYIALKKRWGVSLAALVRRAYDLNRISEPTYRRVNILLNQYKGMEPEEPTFEPPRIIQTCLNDLSSEHFSSSMGLNESDMKSLIELLAPSDFNSDAEQMSLGL